MSEQPLTIFKAIQSISQEIAAVPKDKKNEMQRYNFRGIDDIYLAIHDLLAKYGVFSVPEVIAERSEERKSKNDTALIYRILTIRYTFYAGDGSSFSAVVVGEGMDSGDKASNKAMAVAHKYALLQIFSIPTSEAKDPENDSHEIKPKQQEGLSEQSPLMDKDEKGYIHACGEILDYYKNEDLGF